jgi:nucleoid-associated protein YgaU
MTAQGQTPTHTPALPEAGPATVAEQTRTPVEASKETVATKVERGDTLSQMITSTYGFFSTDLLEKVKKVNPAIRDANKIYAGDMIVFPEGRATLSGKSGQNGQGR